MSLETTLAPIAQIEGVFPPAPAISTAAPAKTVDYIVVQAGGKGTRLEHLTTNKPKALVPVENLPMVFHLFRKFPDKRFIVIADYHREVLREY
ncbi:MAG TPA: sugar phosphate nucleotidyltransferase, partial [Solirubrobacteraceae bacterium]|nr:sugar phosphate nucleotidyltransferase [Solirubrobacteraceae bacterium]